VGSLGGIAAPHLENGYSVVGWPISPGLYAGRIGERVKIGQSMNVAQRVDSFKFEELIGEGGPGIEEAHASRGVAFGDFDNDGDLDILIMNQNEPPSLLRNDVSGNDHWLKVKLVGTKSNRSAIGATVIATYGGKKQAQAVLAQSSYLSVHDRRLHFGLGQAAKADLEIRWPNGTRETIAGVAAGQLVTVKEGTGIAKPERLK